jgi:hypothetical protein
MSVENIIAYLDDYLSRNGIRSLKPVEANALLNKARFLEDRDGNGKPLRVLLRKGFLPHAYHHLENIHDGRYPIPRVE